MFRLPKNFGLRTMLATVALVAITIVVTRDYVRLQSAREQFDWLYAAWQADRVSYDTVVAGSYPLMDVEESTLWMSKRMAQRRHIDRLKQILKQIQSPASEAPPEATKHRSAHIIEQIGSVDPAAAEEIKNEANDESSNDPESN